MSVDLSQVIWDECELVRLRSERKAMSEDLVRMGEDRCEVRERQRRTESERGKRKMQARDAGGEGKGFRRAAD